MRIWVLAGVLFFVCAVTAAAETRTPLVLFTATSNAVRGTDVYVEPVDGGSPTSLTGGVGLATDPVWSPDGSQVAFATNRDTGGTGMAEIYVASADGTSLRRLTFDATQTTGAKGAPQWTPDGAAVAYIAASGPNQDIWEVPATGGTPVRLTTDGAPKHDFAFSPDGTKLLVERNPPGSELDIRDARTGGVLRSVVGSQAVWSPDSDHIAFVDGQLHVAVMSIDSSPFELTNLPSTSPTWSPDGRRVVFSARYTEMSLPSGKFGYPTRTDLYSAPADGAGVPIRLTGPYDQLDVGGQYADRPLFTPDGGELFFHVPGAVWRANTDGTCARPVEGLAAIAEGPFFRPGATYGGATACVDLYVHAAVMTDEVALNRLAGIRFTIENHGDEPAEGVVLHLSPTTPDTNVVGCSRYGGGLDCSIGAIPAGASATFVVNVRSRTAGDRGVGYSVSATPGDITPRDSSGAVATHVLPCTIVGTSGADRLFGTARNDSICGLPGNDYISGGAGNDTIDAGSGDDTIFGGPGQDTILAGAGRDAIFARDGVRDTIDCGPGYDVAVVDRLDKTSHCERVLRK